MWLWFGGSGQRRQATRLGVGWSCAARVQEGDTDGGDEAADG